MGKIAKQISFLNQTIAERCLNEWNNAPEELKGIERKRESDRYSVFKKKMLN